MAKLKTAKESAREKAPDNTGASSVSEGMATTETAPMGGASSEEKKMAPAKKVTAEVEFTFFWPNAPMGIMNLPVGHPVKNEDGSYGPEVEMKQIKVEDKFYVPGKAVQGKKQYFRAFRKELIKAGFKEYSEIKNLDQLREYNKAQPKADPLAGRKMYGAFHPEFLDREGKMNIAFNVNGQDKQYEMVEGKLFTPDIRIHKIWLQNGFEDLGYSAEGKKASKEVVRKE